MFLLTACLTTNPLHSFICSSASTYMTNANCAQQSVDQRDRNKYTRHWCGLAKARVVQGLESCFNHNPENRSQNEGICNMWRHFLSFSVLHLNGARSLLIWPQITLSLSDSRILHEQGFQHAPQWQSNSFKSKLWLYKGSCSLNTSMAHWWSIKTSVCQRIWLVSSITV